MFKKQKSSDRPNQAIATVHTFNTDEEMRMQVEERLKGANPSWSQDSLSIPVPMDTELSEILGQMTGIFPGEKITLETSHGTFDIQSSGSMDAAYRK